MQPKNLMLLTGAGFTHNFGGFLAREMWSKIFNNPIVQNNSEARKILLNDFDFESVYAEKMQHGHDVIEIIRQAVEKAYKDLDDVMKGYLNHYGRGTSIELDTHGVGKLISYMSERGSDKGWFFTLNQDLFMERFKSFRSPGALFPQHSVDNSEGGGVKIKTLPKESEMHNVKNTLCNGSYIKLHGSYGWISSDGTTQMVIGKNKADSIQKKPLLKWYFEVFANLIDNAIKYTSHGSVTITQRVEKGVVTTNFRDTGFGISPTAKERLFQRFYRVQTSETQGISGTGLGLWIIKQYVLAMNGSIDVETMEGVGSNFIVELPAATSK